MTVQPTSHKRDLLPASGVWAIEQFPELVIANIFRFESFELLRFSENEKKDVDVKQLFRDGQLQPSPHAEGKVTIPDLDSVPPLFAIRPVTHVS